MLSERPRNQLIRLNFYNKHGKWKYSGKALVNHYLFEDGFKQDIVDTQTAIVDGWQGEYFVQTSCPEEVNGFFEALFLPSSFNDIERKVK